MKIVTLPKNGVSSPLHDARIDFGRECVLLLCGGDKRKQSTDIARVLEYLKDYKERSGTS